jgi:hypothetical protein
VVSSTCSSRNSVPGMIYIDISCRVHWEQWL